MAKASRLSVLDSTFLRIETSDTPMHVGALMVFEIPDDADPGFVAGVVAGFREDRPLRRPFNQVLVKGLSTGLAPAARIVESIDMEYHVRHTALPAPGGERELGELISHLHSTRLDRSRPLWTCHVIEGLDGNRFAVYVKIHHSLTDGVNGIRLATDQLAVTPDGDWTAPWLEAPPKDKPKRSRSKGGRSVAPHRAATSLLKGLVDLRRTKGDDEPVRVPFEAPPSVLNAPVTNARRVATQQLDMERLRSIAKRRRRLDERRLPRRLRRCPPALPPGPRRPARRVAGRRRAGEPARGGPGGRQRGRVPLGGARAPMSTTRSIGWRW